MLQKRRPLRVGLNLVFLVPGEQGGLETYARELTKALAVERPDLELVAFVGRAAAQDGGRFEGVPAMTVPVDARSRIEWVRGEQAHLPVLARRARVDLVHSMSSTAPAWGPYRRVTTIHDLHYAHDPQTHFGVRSIGMRVLVPLAARRSDHLLCGSQATATDLRAILKVPESKIDVVPYGLGSEPADDPVPATELRNRLAIGDRSVALTASAKRPHKNLARLLEALARIPPERRPVLVLPGYPTPHELELREKADVLGIAHDVRWLGWVDARELEGLYALADAFVFPSLLEGFGLPVLEAMRRGVPVACSNRSSLPEVAGDAALLFDPEDPRAIADALERLLSDREEATRLAERGRRRAAEYTWARCASGTAAVYERVVAASRP
jgi:glycosyltransferase involved in cell wall biosynthesis